MPIVSDEGRRVGREVLVRDFPFPKPRKIVALGSRGPRCTRTLLAGGPLGALLNLNRHIHGVPIMVSTNGNGVRQA